MQFYNAEIKSYTSGNPKTASDSSQALIIDAAKYCSVSRDSGDAEIP